jgi:hypothetical protein
MNDYPDDVVWEKWRRLVNMNPAELREFLRSPWGKVAGLSRQEAAAQGIKSGRDSASWILRMVEAGGRVSFPAAERSWSPSMWQWARRQNGFISRMRGNTGAFYDAEGEPTRLLLSLLVWGHDPERFATGRRGGLLQAIMGR